MRRNRAELLTPILIFLVSLCLCACNGDAEPEAEELSVPQTLIISELMPDNKSTLADGEGRFFDWIELYNSGDEPAELEGLRLNNGKGSVELPPVSVGAGEYRLFFCAKNPGDSEALSLSLSSGGGELSLEDENGLSLDSVSFAAADEDESFVRGEDGAMSACGFPSPGFENTETGYIAAQNLRRTPALAIDEVVVFNCLYPDKDGQFHDIVELKNNSEESVDLGGYYLTDRVKEPQALRLPERSLAPGEIYTLRFTDEMPFKLNSGREQLYLFSEDGSLVDYMALHDIPACGSMGRLPGENGAFYFAAASVGEENRDGARLISAMPGSSQPGGVFNGTGGVEVALSGDGVIRYTLDGSTPDGDSPIYETPLRFESTTVLRAVSFEEGKLPSEALSLSYIINEGHSLPVASLIIDPGWFTDRKIGIYSNPTENWERPGHIEFFDGEDSFDIACGVKVHGATSRIAQSKKSYKLKFREAYGGTLTGDIFDNGVTEFSSMLLRAAQESSFSTHMRDITMHELARQCEPNLSTQDYKYSVLYINGEYWGIYALREAHSVEHFANHYGYDVDDVTMWQGKWADDSDFRTVYDFVMSNDISDSENYHKAVQRMDLESMIAWCVIESYSGNIDINPPNMRFYYTASDGKIHYALVDLDLGLFVPGQFDLALGAGYTYNALISRLLYNEEFEALMLEKTAEYLSGPLSEENTFRVVDELAAQLRPEIERDGERWGYTLYQWENEQQKYLYAVLSIYGHGDYCRYFADSARGVGNISGSDIRQYFGELMN